MLALRKQYLSPGLITYYHDPLLIVEGHMQYLWDETGKQYLDAFAGIVTVSVGHCHPTIVEKVREQVGRLQHTTTIYLHPTIGQLGKKLAEHMPADSGLVGELLHQLRQRGQRSRHPDVARVHRNNDVISLRNGYHGGTQARDGADRARHLEVQDRTRRSTSSTRRPATAIAARTAWSIRAAT